MPNTQDTQARAIEWTPMNDAGEVRVGDVVSTDAGGMPIYRVVALAGAEAWLGGERRDPTLMPLTGFRWRGQFAA
jgi:hypothetical protein